MAEVTVKLKSGIQKLGTACKAIIEPKYRWILTAIALFFIIFSYVIVPVIGTTFYMSLLIILLILPILFSIRPKCMSKRKIITRFLGVIGLAAIGIIILIATDNNALSTLSLLDPTLTESASGVIKDVVTSPWPLAIEAYTSGTAAGNFLFLYATLYGVGMVAIVYADFSNIGGLKSLGGIVMVVPLMIQFFTAMTTGVSIGMLSQYMQGVFDFSQLGTFGAVISFCAGAVIDFILLGVFFSLEKLIPEPVGGE